MPNKNKSSNFNPQSKKKTVNQLSSSTKSSTSSLSTSALSSSPQSKNPKAQSTSHAKFTHAQVAATIFATWVGAEDICAIPQKALHSGLFFIFVIAIGYFLKAIFMSGVIKIASYKNATTVGDIMQISYGNFGKATSGIATITYTFGRLCAQIAAIIFVLKIILQGVLQDDGVVISTCTILLIIITYLTFFKNQGIIKTNYAYNVCTILCMPFYIIVLNEYFQTNGNFEFFKEEWYVYFWLFLTLILPFPGPLTLNRILLNKSEYEAKKSITLAGIFLIIFYFLLILCIFFNQNIKNFALEYCCNMLIIKVFAAVGMFATIVSTLHSCLYVINVTIQNDLWEIFILFGNFIQKTACNFCKNDLWQRKIFKKKHLNYKDKKNSKSNLSNLFNFSIMCAICIFGISVTKYFKHIIDISFYFSNFWIPLIIPPLFAAMYKIQLSSKNFKIGFFISLFTILLLQKINTAYSFFPVIPGFCVHVLFIYFMQNSNKKMADIGK